MGFGVTQAGPGSLPVSSGEPRSSMPSTLFDLPFDVTDGEGLVGGILPVHKQWAQILGETAHEVRWITSTQIVRTPVRSPEILTDCPCQCQDVTLNTVQEWWLPSNRRTFGAALCRNSKSGKNSQTVITLFAKLNKLLAIVSIGLLRLVRQHQLPASMMVGQVRSKEEGASIWFWSMLGATTQNQTMICVWVFGVASSWIRRTDMKKIADLLILTGRHLPVGQRPVVNTVRPKGKGRKEEAFGIPTPIPLFPVPACVREADCMG